MNTTAQLRMFLSLFSVQVPTIIVCIVACVLILARWNQGSRANLWGLLGFGYLLALCFFIPFVQATLQNWVIQSGDRTGKMWVLSAMSIVLSVVHAVTYVFLLLAVLAGRPAPNSPVHRPLGAP